MKHNCLPQQHQLSKWLLSLFLCASFFLFSGSVSNVQPGQHRAVQTELVVNLVQKTNKKLIPYFNKLHSNKHHKLNCYNFFWKIDLVSQHRSLQTKFKALQQAYVSRSPKYFSPLKTIPRNFKEEPQQYLLG